MTCHVSRDEPSDGRAFGQLQAVTFTCDHDGCETVAHDKDIPIIGGLIAMGWECHGGKHFCPEHKTT